MTMFDLLRWGWMQIRTKLLESLLIILGIGLGVAVICAVVGVIDNFTTKTSEFAASQMMRTFELVPITKSCQIVDLQRPLHRVSLVDEELVTPHFEHYQLLKKANFPGLEGVWFSQRGAETLPNLKDLSDMEAEKLVQRWEDDQLRFLLASPDVFQVAELSLVQGDLFRETDLINKNQVVVLGDELAEFLFPDEDPIGKDLILKDGRVKVIGVVNRQNQPDEFASFLVGVSPTDQLNRLAYIPYFSYPTEDAKKEGELKRLYVMAKKDVPLATFYQQLKIFLAEDVPAGLGISGRYLFGQVFSDEHQRPIAVNKLMSFFGCAVLFIAAVNILNLMMARVLSRYRQIGISAALGASRQDIFRLFLGEALIMGFLGSILGVPLAFGAIRLLGKILTKDIGLSLMTGIIGIGVALLTSLVCGLYPATQATKVHPADALKMD